MNCPRQGEPGPRRGGTETQDATVTAHHVAQVRLRESRGRPRGARDPGTQLRLLVTLLHLQEAPPHTGALKAECTQGESQEPIQRAPESQCYDPAHTSVSGSSLQNRDHQFRLFVAPGNRYICHVGGAQSVGCGCDLDKVAVDHGSWSHEHRSAPTSVK